MILINVKHMSDLKLVQELRSQTGAGIGDCQKALTEAGGDIAKAVEILRKQGSLKAAKKVERATKEGVIAMAKDSGKLALVAIACETDFVARNQDFINTVNSFADELLNKKVDEFKVWADQKIKDELVVKIGENIQIASAELIEGNVIGTYLHSNKKTAGVVVLSAGDEGLANDLAMQVVAMSPKYIAPSDIPAEELEKEKEIYREQMKNEGKPAEIIEKIINGKLQKYYEENCLLNQAFIKDEEKKVDALIKEKGADIKVVKFIVAKI